MKLKYDFHIRQIADEYILIPMGSSALSFSGMVSTNEVGAAICEALKQETTYDAVLERVCQEFSVDRETAKADLDEFLARLRKNDILSE